MEGKGLRIFRIQSNGTSEGTTSDVAQVTDRCNVDFQFLPCAPPLPRDDKEPARDSDAAQPAVAANDEPAATAAPPRRLQQGPSWTLRREQKVDLLYFGPTRARQAPCSWQLSSGKLPGEDLMSGNAAGGAAPSCQEKV